MYAEEKNMDGQAEEPGMNTWAPRPNRKLAKEEEDTLHLTFGQQLTFYRLRAGYRSREKFCEALEAFTFTCRQGVELSLNRNTLGDYENNLPGSVLPAEYLDPLAEFFRLTKAQHTFFCTAHGQTEEKAKLHNAYEGATKPEQASRPQHVPTQQSSAPEQRDEGPCEAPRLPMGAQPALRRPPLHHYHQKQSKVRLIPLIRQEIFAEWDTQPLVAIATAGTADSDIEPITVTPISTIQSVVEPATASPQRHWRSRALTWALVAIAALLAVAIGLQSLAIGWTRPPAYPPSPAAVELVSLQRTGPCTWSIGLLGRHFHRYSHITVAIPVHASIDCGTGLPQVVPARSFPSGTVSAKGIWSPPSFIQKDYGIFELKVTDDAGPNHTVGHCVRLTLTYDKSTKPWHAPSTANQQTAPPSFYKEAPC